MLCNGAMKPILKISAPNDLLGYLPYHLGFHPDESIVALAVRGGARSFLGLTMRIDIADLMDPESGVSRQKMLRTHMEEDGADAVLLVMYTKTNPAKFGPADPRAQFARPQLRELIGAFRSEFDSDLPLHGFWVVTPDHYFSVSHDQLPPPDQWFPTAELASTPAAVSAVYAGSSAAPNRMALGDIERAQPRDRDRAQRATLRWLERRKSERDNTWQLETWQLWEDAIAAQLRHLENQTAESPTADPLLLGRLQAGLEDIRIRDAVMISNIPGIGDLPARSVVSDAREEVGQSVDVILDPKVAVAPGIEATAVTELLTAIASHCAHARATPTLTLLAWIAWWKGNGPRGGVLIEKALQADPAYNMARLVERILELGMPPGWIKREREIAQVG